ncbi:MAG TPA: PadR family transcriptional regulator [Candidatus Limnocylindria bacterium]|jgi:DNA-binding PadR family transcriptional regulator
MPKSSAAEDLSPFATPALLVMATLADGPKHGYAIMQEAELISGQPLGPGTLYAALARLERRGLIEALPAEERRRPYRLTAHGATTLQAHLDQLRSFTRQALERLEGGAA